MVSAMSCRRSNIPSSDSSESLLWKDTKRTATALSLNKLVFEAGGPIPSNWKLPSASTTLAPSCKSSSTHSSTTLTLHVPQDFATIKDAVDHANQEFLKHRATAAAAAFKNLNPNSTSVTEISSKIQTIPTKTIKILVDPSMMPVCSIQEPLIVKAHKYGHLVLDVVDDDYKTSNRSSKLLLGGRNPTMPPPSKRARTSSSFSTSKTTFETESQIKGVISMETNVPNQPLIQHTSGSLTVKNFRLDHYSPVDLFVLARTRSQNAAVVVEHEDDDDDCVHNVTLEHVVLTSYAGRGIINRCQDATCEIKQRDCFIAKLFAS